MEVGYILLLLIFPLQFVSGAEKELFQYLFKGYCSTTRPTEVANVPVKIEIGISYNQLLDLDEKKQILTSSLWITETWEDYRLTWNKQDFDGLDSIIVPANRLWKPDIFIFNNAGSKLGDFVNVTEGRAVLSHTGRVTWLVPLMVRSACDIDAKYFPYDRQTCSVYFGSWIYDESQLDVQPISQVPNLQQYLVNSEFDLLGANIKRKVVDGKCCPGNGYHSMVVLQIRIKRKTIYYDYIVIAPTVLLSILSLFSFCLPSHHGDKISIGLTVFVTLYVLQLLISENVPDTNTTPLLGVYTFMIMTLNCTSLIMATFVMNIKSRGKRNPSSSVPTFLSFICRKYLSKITFTKPPGDVKDVELFGPHSLQFDEDDNGLSSDSTCKHCCSDCTYLLTESEAWDPNCLDLFESDRIPQNNVTMHTHGIVAPTDTTDKENITAAVRNDIRLSSETLPRQKRVLKEKNCIDGAEDNETNRGEEQTTMCESNVLKEYQQIAKLKQEWNFIADTIERVFFIIFVSITTVTMATILLIVPSVSA